MLACRRLLPGALPQVNRHLLLFDAIHLFVHFIGIRKNRLFLATNDRNAGTPESLFLCWRCENVALCHFGWCDCRSFQLHRSQIPLRLASSSESSVSSLPSSRLRIQKGRNNPRSTSFCLAWSFVEPFSIIFFCSSASLFPLPCSLFSLCFPFTSFDDGSREFIFASSVPSDPAYSPDKYWLKIWKRHKKGQKDVFIKRFSGCGIVKNQSVLATRWIDCNGDQQYDLQMARVLEYSSDPSNGWPALIQLFSPLAICRDRNFFWN